VGADLSSQPATAPAPGLSDANGLVHVEALHEGAVAEWDAFVAAAGGTLYHRAGWAGIFERVLGQRPLYRLARCEGHVEGVLPLVAFANPWFGRYLVSVPYLNRGGILATSERARTALLEEATRLVEETRAAFCELRHVKPVSETLPRRTNKVSMSLDITCGPEALWRAIGPKVRNLVRKAEKSGVKAREGDPNKDLAAFYEVFAANMRDLGTPVYAAEFFREVFATFPREARLILAEWEGSTAAAGICLTNGAFTEMHWAASRRELRTLSPNMILYWEAITQAAREGLAEFCFGRSTEGSGPHRFKKQWGAEPTPLAWEYILSPGKDLPGLNPDNPKYRLAVWLWQRLPLGWTKRLGPPIVRHIP
jgi:FemAB-related protein (PEP-CTERM system-associated)